MADVILQPRHDTAANWTSNNPTLLVAERGYEEDTGLWKTGDGSTVWTSLPYDPSGNVAGQSSSVDSEIALFSGIGGKTIKRATGSGYVKATSGVYSTSAAIPEADVTNLATDLAALASNDTTLAAAIALKAPLASPALTGTPTAPTAAAGTASTQIATTAYHDNNLGVIYVRAVTTSSFTSIATGLENGDTLDGITLATGDLVLDTADGTASARGVYVVQASGTAVRSTHNLRAGQMFYVTEGTQYHDTVWSLTTDGTITVGSTALTIAQLVPNLPSLWPLVTTGVWQPTEVGSASTQATTLNRGYYIPFVVPRNVSLSDFAFEVTTGGAAGAVMRGGLLQGSLLTLLPSTLVADYGTIVATTTGIKKGSAMSAPPGTAPPLTAGNLYFIALVSQVALCTVRVRQTINPLCIQSTANLSINVLATAQLESGRSGALASSPTISDTVQGPAVQVQFS